VDEIGENHKSSMKTHPRNVLKYCPRCGSKQFFTLNHGRSFICEECNFNYYFNNSAAVACLIFNKDGHLMLARRAIEPNIGMLDLPGGFVEPNETAEEAVIREIKEELQVRITEMSYLVSFPNEYVYSDLTVFTLDLAFICKINDRDEIVPGDDISDVEFIDPRIIEMNTLCSDSMRKIISFYLLRHYK
jgi:mutator protein MutT